MSSMDSQADHSEHRKPDAPHDGVPPADWSNFESTMQVGDYAMPRAGKTRDYMTDADKKANSK